MSIPFASRSRRLLLELHHPPLNSWPVLRAVALAFLVPLVERITTGFASAVGAKLTVALQLVTGTRPEERRCCPGQRSEAHRQRREAPDVLGKHVAPEAGIE